MRSVVRSVPNVHPIIRWKPRVGHPMHWLPIVGNLSIVVHLPWVIHAGIFDTIVLGQDGGTVMVLLVMFWGEYAAIFDIGHIRICKV